MRIPRQMLQPTSLRSRCLDDMSGSKLVFFLSFNFLLILDVLIAAKVFQKFVFQFQGGQKVLAMQFCAVSAGSSTVVLAVLLWLY